jgi:PHD/YefM family antitoxin component YafN of YafNO toxin-antitoxin module
MVTVHPNILERDGKKEFVVLPYEEFVTMEEELQDYDDLKALRAAKDEEADAPTVSLAEARKELVLGKRPVAPARRR